MLKTIAMHVHVCHLSCMRTTIEIPDTQRARLLDLAARRGEKGFSRLVQEAVERMLAEDDFRESRTKAAIALEGSIGERAADELTASVARIRSTWR
jgi:metal-responsive CopG/Arc/MetJ family transcriptional regulator